MKSLLGLALLASLACAPALAPTQAHAQGVNQTTSNQGLQGASRPGFRYGYGSGRGYRFHRHRRHHRFY